MKSYNVAHTSPDNPDPRLRDRTYAASAEQIVAALRTIATELPRWRLTGYEAATGTVRLEHDTPIITFTDDITLHLCRSNGRIIVSGRSAARVGTFDFGVNARNLRSLLAALDEHMEGE